MLPHPPMPPLPPPPLPQPLLSLTPLSPDPPDGAGLPYVKCRGLYAMWDSPRRLIDYSIYDGLYLLLWHIPPP